MVLEVVFDLSIVADVNRVSNLPTRVSDKYIDFVDQGWPPFRSTGCLQENLYYHGNLSLLVSRTDQALKPFATTPGVTPSCNTD